VKIYNEMATFGEAGVSERNEDDRGGRLDVGGKQ